jgi:hypothetical protein
LINRTNLAPVAATTGGIGGGQISSTFGVFWAAPALGPGEPPSIRSWSRKILSDVLWVR